MSCELERCPFCGSTAKVVAEAQPLPNGKVDVLYYVECENAWCSHRGIQWFPEEAAIRAWNVRTSQIQKDLVMLISRMAYRHNKGLPIAGNIDAAVDYMKRKGLLPSPLREKI